MDPVTQQKIEELSQRVEQLHREGRYPAAIPLAAEAAQLLKQTVGEADLRFIRTTTCLANLYRVTEDYDQAKALYQWALVVLKRQVANSDPADLVNLLNGLGDLFRATGRFKLAEQHLTEALTLQPGRQSGDNPTLAQTIHNLGLLHMSRGHYAEAETQFTKALQMRRDKLPEDDPIIAQSLHDQAQLYHAWGKFDQAKTHYRDAFRRRMAVYGKIHPEVGQSLRDQAKLFHDLGQYDEAEPLYNQAIEISRALFGEEHPLYATDVDSLAQLDHDLGRYGEAETYYQQALHIRQTKFGQENSLFARSVEHLARLRYTQGDYTEARRLQQWALQIKQKALGKKHPDEAATLDDLAQSWQALGNYERAVSLLTESLTLRRELVSDRHPDLAATLDKLAVVHQTMGNYRQAEQNYQDALSIQAQVLSAVHPDRAASLHNLATLYLAIADYTQAQPLFEQALDIRQQTLGDRHPAYAESLFQLGRVALATGDYPQAKARLVQVRDIQQASLGAAHPTVAQTLTYLADACCSLGDYEAAEPLYVQAKDIWQAGGGEKHPDFARGLHNLANLYQAQGRHDLAKSIYQWALQIRKKSLGNMHADVAETLASLAVTYTALDLIDLAQQTMMEAAAIHDQLIRTVFAIGSERQRLAHLRTFTRHLDIFLSLITGYLVDSVEARQAGYDMVLRRKALGAEMSVSQREAFLSRRHPNLAEQFKALQTLRQQIGQKMLAGPGLESSEIYKQTLADWTRQRERLEVELARQVDELNLVQDRSTSGWQQIQAALPENAVLIEWVQLTPFNFKARPAYGEQPWQPARYLAFVTTDKEPLQIFDLGEAAPLNRMIEEFRFAVTGDPTEREKRGLFYDQSPETDQLPDVAVGQQLRSALFNPLMPAIGDNHRLFLAPDGNLSRLPFEILPLNEDRRLIDDYQISYLNVGRELLRMGTRPDGQSTPPIVVADPDFDLTVTPNSNAQNVTEEAQLLPSRQSKDLRGLGLHFGRLPGTRTEGQQIAEKLGVSPFMAEAALEASLKNLASPKIVHIATHGFFLPDQERDKSGPDDGNQWGRLSHGFENPLLRSGLALAGINTWITHGDMLPTAEDGVLTAEDVVSLDLRNTELVVLSACETGLGEVQVGEGVFGLRRAFILAGAKTLVMSLWKVPDQQTQDLMIDFYHRILAGEPRAEALRQAQLAMKQKYPEPLYWGAFICQGDPGPLEETN